MWDTWQYNIKTCNIFQQEPNKCKKKCHGSLKTQAFGILHKRKHQKWPKTSSHIIQKKMWQHYHNGSSAYYLECINTKYTYKPGTTQPTGCQGKTTGKTKTKKLKVRNKHRCHYNSERIPSCISIHDLHEATQRDKHL